MCGGRQGRKSNFLFSPNLTNNDTCTWLTLLPHGSHQLEQRTNTKRDNRTLPKKEQIWIREKETKLSKRAPNTENAPPSLVFKKPLLLSQFQFQIPQENTPHSKLKNVNSENKLQKASCRVVTHQTGFQIPSRGRVRSRSLKVHPQNTSLFIVYEEIY